MELAQYSVKPNIFSILLPQFFKLAGLCAAFYFGVWVNFFILRREFPLWITAALVFALAALLAVQLLITKARAGRWHYDFFSNRVEFYGEKLKSILYSNVQQVKVSRTIFDNIAGTGTIVLSKDFKISNIPNYAEIQNYLNQLVQSFRTQRVQQYSAQYIGG